MGGQCYFSSTAHIDEMHDKYLPESYFPIVGAVPRFPRYQNKRIEDPFVRMFIDEEQPHVMDNYEWALPVPNEEAAYKSLAKYGKDIPSMTQDKVEQMNRAWNWTFRHFAPYMQNASVRSYQQVKEKLDMTTSCGAPFNFLYKTKKELFENDKEIDQWFEEDWNTLGSDENWTCPDAGSFGCGPSAVKVRSFDNDPPAGPAGPCVPPLIITFELLTPCKTVSC